MHLNGNGKAITCDKVQAVGLLRAAHSYEHSRAGIPPVITVSTRMATRLLRVTIDQLSDHIDQLQESIGLSSFSLDNIRITLDPKVPGNLEHIAGISFHEARATPKATVRFAGRDTLGASRV